MADYSFNCQTSSGDIVSVKFDQLKIVVEGPIQLAEPGWQGDRINYCKQSGTLIEFQSGPEGPPGFQPSRAREVTAGYVCSAYKITEKELAAVIGAQQGVPADGSRPAGSGRA